MSADIRPGQVPPELGQHRDSPSTVAWTSPAQTPPPSPVMPSRPARWPTLTALAVALIALAVSTVGWFRPAPHNNQPPPRPAYTQQRIAAAKARVCATVGKFNRAVSVGNSLPRGSDSLVSDLNSRQIFDVFSRLSLATLAEEPETPPDLATAVREQASSLEEAVIAYQDGLGTSDPEVRPILDASSAAAETIQQLCK